MEDNPSQPVRDDLIIVKRLVSERDGLECLPREGLQERRIIDRKMDKEDDSWIVVVNSLEMEREVERML